jgi:hypothetical protein
VNSFDRAPFAIDTLDYWRLCDELTVVQAALLIAGEDPSPTQDYIANWEPDRRPAHYVAAKAALMHAINGKRLSANVIEPIDKDVQPGPDWYQTTVLVEDLRVWLKSRGFERGFFFPAPKAGPDYLSAGHQNYSSKLAAAIQSWQAVSEDRNLRQGKSVKQALAIWLRQHANEFGLTKDDGNPNEQGIEEIAKIANWDTKGGAPKTPGNE